MRTIEQKIFTIGELDGSARNAAIEHYRDVNLDYYWYEGNDYLLEFSEEELNRFFTPEAKAQYLERKNPLFVWSQFYFDLDEYIQFDGLRVEDDELFFEFLKIPETLRDKIGFSFYSRSSNSNTEIEFREYDDISDEERRILDEAEAIFDDKIEEARILLRQEYEYRSTDEAIIETIEANEYEFFEDGSPYYERRSA